MLSYHYTSIEHAVKIIYEETHMLSCRCNASNFVFEIDCNYFCFDVKFTPVIAADHFEFREIECHDHEWVKLLMARALSWNLKFMPTPFC